MKNQVKRFTQFITEKYQSEDWAPELGEWQDDDFNAMHKKSQCCGSEIDEEGYCTECGEHADDSHHDSWDEMDRQHKSNPDKYLAAPPREINLDPEELYEAKKKAQIEALKAVDKKFANLKPVGKKKAMPEEEEEMEEAPKKGAKAKPAAKGMPFGKKAEKPAAKGMPFGKPAAKPAAKPFGFQKKGANKENEM